jgi:hypothetical protein
VFKKFKLWPAEGNSLTISPIGDTALMHSSNSPESSGVPHTIMSAERWRLAGSKLRRLSPEIYEQIFTMLVASLPDDNDETDKIMLQSYLVT